MKENKNKEIILVIFTGLTVLGLVVDKKPVIITGIAISVLSLILPIVEKWIVFSWLKLTHILGWINSKILLTLVFYLFLTPISLLKKLFSSTDSLKLKQPQNTNWVNREHLFTKIDLEQPF